MSNADANIPTPRTDAEVFEFPPTEFSEGVYEWVPAKHARQLERELADISGQLERRNDGFRKAIDLCVEKDREIDRLEADLAAAIVHRVNCHDKIVEALQNALQHLELYEEKCDGEWGSCRYIEEIEADGELPPIIVSTRAALELTKGGGHD